jgi:hypothetical protein
LGRILMPSRGKQTNSTQPGCSKSTDSKSFYPDLVTKGGLVNALNAELQMIGSPLTACGLSDQKPSGFPTYASVESGDSFCQVYIAAEERLFMHDFWRKGVCLAEGMTPRIHDVAISINAWVSERITTAKLKSRFQFVEVMENAEAFESGKEVDYRWEEYSVWIPRRYPELVEFFMLAREEPRLRCLFPFTSLNRLCFSKCTGFPYFVGCPPVEPAGDGQYLVRLGGKVHLKGCAEIILEYLLDVLPEDCGPAVSGTAEDLGNDS